MLVSWSHADRLPQAPAARDLTYERSCRIEEEVKLSSSAHVKVDGKICDDKAEAVSDKNDSQCGFWLAGIERRCLSKADNMGIIALLLSQ